MSDRKGSVNIIGGGIFGASAALVLKRRGFDVSLFDRETLPSPLAASTDISKAIRMDYGSDEFYMRLMEEALAGWEDWNRGWGRELYHPGGIIFLSKGEMKPGEFEHGSFTLLKERGYDPLRATDPVFHERFPVWDLSIYLDGYYNPEGGWAESGKVVAALVQDLRREGVRLYENHRIDRLVERGTTVAGVRVSGGDEYLADFTILAAGTWTPIILPELQEVMWSVGQPVFHFRVDNPAEYQPPRFVTWGADISNTGWYGFPSLDDGTLKLANHGRGWRFDPDGPREIPAGVEDRFREFLSISFPEIAGAPLMGSRMCFYCDTWDGDFWIDRHPGRSGLIVAAGGSGHGFKFAPKIGEMVADLVEGKSNIYQSRFAWRERGSLKSEEARHSRLASLTDYGDT
jgi:glycine/D-amino acid oxidase-like deaminating enzyme